MSFKALVDRVFCHSFCLLSLASLSLYRQGWSRLGGPSFGRFIQIPNGLQSQVNESCIQAMIELTLTQQSEIVIGIKVETVKFQPISALVEEGINMTERMVNYKSYSWMAEVEKIEKNSLTLS